MKPPRRSFVRGATWLAVALACGISARFLTRAGGDGPSLPELRGELALANGRLLDTSPGREGVISERVGSCLAACAGEEGKDDVR